MTDPQFGTINKAIFAAQKKMGAVIKSALNPHFKSKYAKLEDVLETIEPPLTEHGVMVLQPVGKDEKGHYVETVFTHVETGEYLSSKMYLAANADSDSPKLCAAITYARRFSLLSFLSLPCADEEVAPEPAPEEKIEALKALISQLDPAKSKIALGSLTSAGKDMKELSKIENRVKALLGEKV